MKQIILTIIGLIMTVSTMGADKIEVVAEHGTVLPTVEDTLCTLTVTPDSGYYIRMTDIIVEKTIDPGLAKSRTRGDSLSVSDT